MVNGRDIIMVVGNEIWCGFGQPVRPGGEKLQGNVKTKMAPPRFLHDNSLHDTQSIHMKTKKSHDIHEGVNYLAPHVVVSGISSQVPKSMQSHNRNYLLV